MPDQMVVLSALWLRPRWASRSRRHLLVRLQRRGDEAVRAAREARDVVAYETCPVCARLCRFDHRMKAWVHLHNGAYLCERKRRV